MEFKAVSSSKRRGILAAVLCFSFLVLISSVAWAVGSSTVYLNTWTSPSAGAAGASNVFLTGSGFPSGAISPGNVVITIAPTCGGSPTTAATALTVTHILGTIDRIGFLIPASLATGNYFAWISGTSDGGVPFASNTPGARGACSEFSVQGTTKGLSTCLPSSSLGVLSGKTTVTAYVPNGTWGGGANNVEVVPIEGGGSPSLVTTSTPVNSCSSNSVTGQTACVDNGTKVYIITGSTLSNTLNSSANAFAGFSGGECKNCGVAFNALTNTAVIEMGYTPSTSNSALQFLNLNTNAFAAPFPLENEVSEDIQVDPTRNFILSPNENNVYDVIKMNSDGTLSEYAYDLSATLRGEMDSAAEDCATGIGLASQEFTPNVFFIDLSQATFTPGSGGAAGTFTAPSQSVAFPDFERFSAGTDGIAMAPGTTHLGIVTGEFGGNQFGVLKLPATSGTGGAVPAPVDWAGAHISGISAGFDPHTVTAYTSPNNNKSYGVIADWSRGTPCRLAVIDLAGVLAAPRTAGVDAGGSACASCSHSVDPTYDLVAHGLATLVDTGAPGCPTAAAPHTRGRDRQYVRPRSVAARR
jgi:hypothetical protein